VANPPAGVIPMRAARHFAENLSAEMTPAYPGYGQGDWTCRPDHPLDRVQPGVTLPGTWNATPMPDLPIG
jgi:hypothetical protein